MSLSNCAVWRCANTAGAAAPAPPPRSSDLVPVAVGRRAWDQGLCSDLQAALHQLGAAGGPAHSLVLCASLQEQ